MNRDERWMTRALELAEKGRDRTHPNPLVGAVLVKRGKVVSEGFHGYFGGPHAEIVALRRAGGRARGATLYLTLEPCSSWGKTPPCVDRVIESGVARVVIGSIDPDPKNQKTGIRQLKRSGIRVRVGVKAKEIRAQSREFFKFHRTGLPFVTLKLAQSLDGKIATRTGRSRWISSKASRAFVHRLRNEADAVLVGTHTALQDNPRLRGTSSGGRPWRVVLDSGLKIRSNARIFKGTQQTFVAVRESHLRHAFRLNHARKVLLPVPEKRGKLDLEALLRHLVALGVCRLLVEGGGEVAWSLIREGLVDRLIWIVAPKIIGGRNAKTSVEGEGVASPSQAFPVAWEKTYRLGEDWIFEANLCSRES